MGNHWIPHRSTAIWNSRLSTPKGRIPSLFRVAVLRIIAGSTPKPASKFAFTTYTPPIGGIGCLTSFRAWRYVEPNQCFKLIIAFVADPRMTYIVALEKLRIGGRVQQFATFWAGAPPEIPFINEAPRHRDARPHSESLSALNRNLAPTAVHCCVSAFNFP